MQIQDEKLPTTPVSKVRQPTCLELTSQFVHTRMQDGFAALAKKVTTYPKLAVLGVFLLTVALAQGIWVFEQEKEGRELFTPRNSRAVDEDEYIENTFGFDPRLTTFYLAANGDNVLTAQYMNLLMALKDEVTLRLSQPGGDGVISYNTTCKRVRSNEAVRPCLAARGPLALWGNVASSVAQLSDADVLAAVNNEEQWREFEPSRTLATYLSEVGLQRDEDGNITHAKAVYMQLVLKSERGDKHGGNEEDEESRDFELQMVDYVVDVFKAVAREAGAEIEIMTRAEVREASDVAVNGDLGVLGIGYLLMLSYSCFVLSRARPKYSHAVLGVVSVVSVGMCL